MTQPGLFEPRQEINSRLLLLYALGEFQARGHELANRELALDRLHQAFVRAAVAFGVPEMSDEEIVAGLRQLDVTVHEIPKFFAKRPYRITVPEPVCRLAAETIVKISAKRGNKI